MRRIAATAVALATFTAASGARAQESAPRIRFQTFTLDNGLTFIVHEDHSTPIVAVDIWYDVGSANERPGRSGFAHLFEHMLFQETDQLKPGEFKKLVQDAGGTYNGTTNQDRTAYFETLPSNRLNLAFWLESDRMAHLKVDSASFSREREVVKEERRLRIDNQPYGVALLTLDTLAADWKPYHHPVIGSMADLDAATPADVRAFYRQFYVPNNATVVVAGDVKLDEVRDLARKYFGAIPRGPEPPALPPMPSTPRTDGERRVKIESELANTAAYFAGFNIPPHDDPDTHALQLLSSIFSDGQSSRLYRRLVKEEGAALTVFSSLDSRVGPGVFFFGGIPNQGVGIARIEMLVNDEVDRLKEDGVTAEELQKAKNQFKADLITEWETVFRKSMSIQHFRLFHGDPAAIDHVLADIDRVTLEDIKRVANTYLVSANRTVVTVVPAGQSATR